MNRWRVRILAALLGVVIGWGLARVAHGTELDLLTRVEAYLERQRRTWDPIAEPSQVAVAVTNATKDPKWAALLLTIARHESNFSARIGAGRCRDHECDDGLAWGLWQVHRTTENAPAWGNPNPSVQAQWASYALHGMDQMCRRAGVPFPLGVLRAYATGRGCKKKFAGERARLRTYNEILKGL